MNALAAQLQTYFSVFARTQRDLSSHTISAYRDTWRMLITFLAARTGTRAEHIGFDHLDADSITAFLDHLEHERGNSISTRNARLCAIRAVLTHAMVDQLDYAATITDPTQASPQTDARVPHPRRVRRPARSAQPCQVDRSPRPRPPRPGNPDRATNQRAALPDLRGHTPRNGCERHLRRQRQTHTGHTADRDDQRRHDRLPPGTRPGPATLCSADPTASSSHEPPSNADSPSTSPRPQRITRASPTSTSRCTPCGTPPR